MQAFNDLRLLSKQIKDAQEKYYKLDYLYRKTIDQIRQIEADILVNGEINRKTSKERELEFFHHTKSMHEEKRRLCYEANLAKAKWEALERQFRIALTIMESESNIEQLK